MRLLRGRGIAPDFAGFWPAAEGRGAVLAYRFVEGARWAGDVAEAAALLRRVHRIETSGFRDVPASPREPAGRRRQAPRAAGRRSVGRRGWTP